MDSPTRLDECTGAVLSVADHALVSVRPSGLDLWSTAEFLEVLAGRGLPLLDGFTFRVAYAQSLSEGLTVLDGSDDTAREEVHQLLRDVGGLLS